MTSKQRVLQALKDAGEHGLNTVALCQPEVGGVRFSARIQELRDDGYDIQSTCIRLGSWRYWLVPPAPAPVPAPEPSEKAPPPSLFDAPPVRPKSPYETEEAA